ncbi:MAG: hypothetical protein QNL04_00470 [SAR324 cluster bacterium]|nr:hypothetical protein [SAR324 cluster bacterium]
MAGVSLTDLKGAIGSAALEELIKTKGGQVVWIPKVLEEGHWLIQLLGLEAAENLSVLLGGAAQTVPKGRNFQSKCLQRKLEALKAEGYSVNEIAKITNMHQASIYRRLAGGYPAIKNNH